MLRRIEQFVVDGGEWCQTTNLFLHNGPNKQSYPGIPGPGITSGARATAVFPGRRALPTMTLSSRPALLLLKANGFNPSFVIDKELSDRTNRFPLLSQGTK